MTNESAVRSDRYPPHGQIGYVQLPALDIAASAAFYEAVFGWHGELEYGSFEAPGMIGQWSRDLPPATSGGPVLWLCVDRLWAALTAVTEHGGLVRGRPRLDQGQRWLVEIDDPAGNRLGVVAAARTAQPQTMIAVNDVEASSRWYQQVLGLVSDHGGAEYDRLLADGVLVLQLHQRDVEHHHGRVAGDNPATTGSGALLWFGEVADFDAVLARAHALGVEFVRAEHRNPPDGEGNGPGHREVWLRDPDGYTVVVASPDAEAWEPRPGPS